MKDEMPKTAPEIMDEMVKELTLDYYLKQDPKNLTEENMRNHIILERQQRAMFIKKQAEKD